MDRYELDEGSADKRDYEPSITAGALIEMLKRYPEDAYVTIAMPCDGPVESDWMNVCGAYVEPEGVSIQLLATDDFDTRQW
jgi:hypothetical protein